MSNTTMEESLSKLSLAKESFRKVISQTSNETGSWDMRMLSASPHQEEYTLKAKNVPMCRVFDPSYIHTILVKKGIWVLRNCTVSYILNPGDRQTVNDGEWVLETVDPTGECHGVRVRKVQPRSASNRPNPGGNGQ